MSSRPHPYSHHMTRQAILQETFEQLNSSPGERITNLKEFFDENGVLTTIRTAYGEDFYNLFTEIISDLENQDRKMKGLPARKPKKEFVVTKTGEEVEDLLKELESEVGVEEQAESIEDLLAGLEEVPQSEESIEDLLAGLEDEEESSVGSAVSAIKGASKIAKGKPPFKKGDWVKYPMSQMSGQVVNIQWDDAYQDFDVESVSEDGVHNTELASSLIKADPPKKATKTTGDPNYKGITFDEFKVLNITLAIKAFARDKYFMQNGLKKDKVKKIRESLMEKGLLNKNTAISKKGEKLLDEIQKEQGWSRAVSSEWEFEKREPVWGIGKKTPQIDKDKLAEEIRVDLENWNPGTYWQKDKAEIEGLGGKGQVYILVAYRDLGEWENNPDNPDDEDPDDAVWVAGELEKYVDKFRDYVSSKSWWNEDLMDIQVFTGEKYWAYFRVTLK